MTDQELRNLIAENSRAIKELRESQKKTDEQMKKTDEKIAKGETETKKLRKMLGSMGLLYGDITEEMVYRGLQNLFHAIGKDFDSITQNLKKKGEIEYDIVAVNGSEVLVTEVKGKVRKDDIDVFSQKRLPQFKKFFPQYKNYKILGAIGGSVVRADIEKYAEKNGLYVITQNGDNLSLTNKPDFKAKVFA